MTPSPLLKPTVLDAESVPRRPVGLFRMVLATRKEGMG